MQTDPHAIQDMIGFVEIDREGVNVRFRLERPFYICKGLKMFAEGVRYDIPKEKALTQIAEAGGKFKLTELQLNLVYKNRQATLNTAIESLGLSSAPNVDERISLWLDQTVTNNEDGDVNSIAAQIISDLIKN